MARRTNRRARTQRRQGQQTPSLSLFGPIVTAHAHARTLRHFLRTVYEPLPVAGKNKGTVEKDLTSVNALGRFLRREPTLDDLSDDLLEEFTLWLLALPRSQTTVSQYLRSLLTIWRYAWNNGDVESQPGGGEQLKAERGAPAARLPARSGPDVESSNKRFEQRWTDNFCLLRAVVSRKLPLNSRDFEYVVDDLLSDLAVALWEVSDAMRTLTEDEWRERAVRMASNVVRRWRDRKRTLKGRCESRSDRLTDAPCCDSPAENASNRERAAVINDALRRLGDSDRQLITAVCIDGMTVKAASRSLGMSHERGGQRLTALLAALARQLPASLGTPGTLLVDGKVTARTSADDIAIIRKRWSLGASANALAREYGLHQGTISRICYGQTERYEDLTPLMRSRRRLSEDDVAEIRSLTSAGQTASFIGERFNLSRTTVNNAANGKRTYARA